MKIESVRTRAGVKLLMLYCIATPLINLSVPVGAAPSTTYKDLDGTDCVVVNYSVREGNFVRIYFRNHCNLQLIVHWAAGDSEKASYATPIPARDGAALLVKSSDFPGSFWADWAN